MELFPHLGGTVLCLPGGFCRIREHPAALGGLPAVTGGQLALNGLHPRGQGIRLSAGVSQLPGQRTAVSQLPLQVRQLRLQRRELAGPVVPAAVQLLFQGFRGLCIRGALLP